MLARITTELADAVASGAEQRGRTLSKAGARREAEMLLAVTDGLTFDAVTSGQQPDGRPLGALLDTYLRRVID